MERADASANFTPRSARVENGGDDHGYWFGKEQEMLHAPEVFH
jgi:hypothetical protein